MRRNVVLLLVGLCASASAQTGESPSATTESDRAIEASKIAAAAVAEYRFSREGEQPALLVLEPKSLLQWSNPVAGSIHGSVFIWTEKGRPEMVATPYKLFGPRFFHLGLEFHSLSTSPIRAERGEAVVWTPTKPGLSFAPVPGAPTPAESPSARLRQMRDLAQQFSARGVKESGIPLHFRLLTQPIHRYASTDPSVRDGGLFAFVEGTDPEVLLLIEARRREGGAFGWDYAIARLNSMALHVEHRGREVWSTPSMPWEIVFGHAEPYTLFLFENDDANSPGFSALAEKP
ncbi:MAG: hypothetical protein P4L85_20415 [Paludisphaera borealis]|uniref:hypothetical protein n=1 Tax=Paludisphaera borealis TaxID=1387353 RepID=UPI002840FB69|nr:hypothetical protein [Paludisphaera borealis]MDR3621728.1 hypothetical protein [Paludisphaera borealis]